MPLHDIGSRKPRVSHLRTKRLGLVHQLRTYSFVRSYEGTPFVRRSLYITIPLIRNRFYSILYNIQHTLYLPYSHSDRHTKYAPT
ncbi:hypothetical protein HanIR_Chr05g0213031 [Helianthus annuus]|nr:hypothetical protein HanIR_Chr05g0213031 [Helianthus annuus]